MHNYDVPTFYLKFIECWYYGTCTLLCNLYSNALTTEFWLAETFVIIVKVVSESFYCLSGKFISSLPAVPIMRHVWDYETHKYYCIMNAIV